MRLPHSLVVVAVALAAALLAWSVDNDYYLRILFMMGVYYLCAAGMNVLVGYAGQKSLGQAGLFAAGAYTAALLTTSFDLDPWVAAVVAALLTTWVTFVPCFLFILLGAPYVERLRGNRDLAAALAGITAAVVGVIASLAVFFALHTLFGETARLTAGPLDLEYPRVASLDAAALAITALGCALVFWRGWSVLRTLGACALAGVVLGLAMSA